MASLPSRAPPRAESEDLGARRAARPTSWPPFRRACGQSCAWPSSPRPSSPWRPTSLQLSVAPARARSPPPSFLAEESSRAATHGQPPRLPICPSRPFVRSERGRSRRPSSWPLMHSDFEELFQLLSRRDWRCGWCACGRRAWRSCSVKRCAQIYSIAVCFRSGLAQPNNRPLRDSGHARRAGEVSRPGATRRRPAPGFRRSGSTAEGLPDASSRW